ncbi:hypothetical protein A3K29_05210 [Candidatus Collierbacteria bacterium RIFOXYB2_FULL_46_14]|nr:MAG: hypothetical protein A3K29_05210 [Candidatus Collierbacteria bacterium RIFOXYB2_FULL_46_14]OGD76534.1 MAG: hypothetical protein A3K43_05210 [Candidatus Collierbacteria bacterium RIFOXYA2_FULL_46_20]OGD77870.1 MAG: hypothetical protein A3K39_05210 [Candidatus Collierbacteria bacterium RIFOXYC2_FULL_43_15]OGD81160.1 MAG: hypothetical protein A2320_05705 [Pseudomonadales bacterium GWC2_63_15]OGD82592.1 MAG: hypothetical protein A3K36_05210 [Candidatus Collierbacteria bacterium RIFOXYD2_FUL
MFPLYTFTLGGILTIIFVFFTLHQAGEIIGVGRVIAGVTVVLLFAFMGYGVSLMNSTNFHRKVANPVVLEKLSPEVRYWLNGETWARYYGHDEDSGQFKFGIWGRNDLTDPNDYELIPPWKVKAYFSLSQEVFS